MAFTIHAGETVNGSSRRPTNIEVNETGIAIGAFKRVMNPWSEVMAIEIFGPDSQTSRVTATRLAALGILAFAFKKSTTETLVVVSLKSGGTQNLMFLKKSEPEVRALFSPFMSRISNDSVISSSGFGQKETAVQHKPTVSKVAEIRELADLFEKGFIDESEFKDLKMRVMNDIEEFELPVESDYSESENIETFDLSDAGIVLPETLVAGNKFIYRISGWSQQDIEELAYEVGMYMFDMLFFPKRLFRRTQRELRVNKSVTLEVPFLNDYLLDKLVNKFHCDVQIRHKPSTALNFEARENALLNGRIIDVSPFRDPNAIYDLVMVGVHEENLINCEEVWNLFLEHDLPVESINLLKFPGFTNDRFELPLGVPLVSMKESESDVLIQKLDLFGVTAERFWTQPTKSIFV